MKVELKDDVVTLTVHEVVEQLESCGAIELHDGEVIGESRLENGSELEIDIDMKIEDDPRCSGYNVRTVSFTMSDIKDRFTAADYYTWAKDEDGDDILLCFGAC